MSPFFDHLTEVCKTILSDTLTYGKSWETELLAEGDRYITHLFNFINKKGYIEIWAKVGSYQMAYETWDNSETELIRHKVMDITDNVELFDFMDRMVNDIHNSIAIIEQSE